ncbi:hypothetical protein SHIRM173S_08878 [Streptomyces hirsutus]
MSMSRAASMVDTWRSSFGASAPQPSANFRYPATSVSASLSSSGVKSVCVYASISGPSRHSTGSLRATPRGSTATMS